MTERDRGAHRKIAEEIARLGGLTVAALGLRFDRVAISVLDRAKTCAEGIAPDGKTVLLTISAPIWTPARTIRALGVEMSALVATGLVGQDWRAELHRNEVVLRLADSGRKPELKFVGLVRNPDVSTTELLDLAARWLRT